MEITEILEKARSEGWTDEEIVDKVRAGETALYEIIMRRYNQRLYRVARAILRDDNEAEDVMQDAYVRAYQHLDQFARRAPFSTWLTRIAVHEALARVRQRNRTRQINDSEFEGEFVMKLAEPSLDPEQTASTSELMVMLALIRLGDAAYGDQALARNSRVARSTMKSSQPPILPTKLLQWLASGLNGDAVAGDLVEQYQQGRSAVWYWRQALLAIVVSFAKDRTLGGPAILGFLLVVLLVVVSVLRHPASLGTGLLITDLALLSGYGAFAIWVWRQRRPDSRDALTAGAQTALILAVVLITSHAIEWFALFESGTAQLVRGAGSTLLMLGLLGAAGSAAWQRTRSTMLAVIAGLWCGSLATLILLSFALTLNLAFPAHAASWLHEALVASGMSDAGTFVVRNSLEAASEILVRIPVAALLLAFCGALSNALITGRSRTVAVVAAWFTPFIFTAGAAALWYADSLERAARPPFVIVGVMAAGIALCGAHPIWSSLSQRNRELPHGA